jgi:fumarate reductase (CoM/CoB) subunit A
MDSHREIETDVLIIGSEAAGARAAIEIADRKLRVLLVTKGIMGRSAVTVKASYSVAGAFGFADPRDTPQEHLSNTVAAGRYVNNQALAEIMTREGPERLDELGKWGMKWEKAADGRYHQMQMYGHTYPRSLTLDSRFKKKNIGLEIVRVLRREVTSRSLITLKNDVFVSAYLTASQGGVNGCVAIDLKTGEVLVIRTKTVIDATGGGMFIYKNHSAAPESTGDGYAMGYRAGAELVDMEFVQFIPIQLYHPPTNVHGERFMRRYDPERMEFTDRDVMSRAIALEIKNGRGTPHGGVWLDASYLADKIIETVIEKRAPNWISKGGTDLLKHGLDLRKVPLEIGPAAHYFSGGLNVHEHWATTVPGLFAAGEVAGGAHGANRIPGNALEETQVSAVRSARGAAEYARAVGPTGVDKEQIQAEKERVLAVFAHAPKGGTRPFKLIHALQDLMWNTVGVLRNESGLTKAIEAIERIKTEQLPYVTLSSPNRLYNRDWIDYLELGNMLAVGEMIARAALFRTESRGAHYREDYPDPSREWHKNITVRLSGTSMVLTALPVTVTKIQLPAEEVQGGYAHGKSKTLRS